MEKSHDSNNCLKLYRVLNRNETDYGALFQISTTSDDVKQLNGKPVTPFKVNTFFIKLIMELYICIDVDFML